MKTFDWTRKWTICLDGMNGSYKFYSYRVHIEIVYLNASSQIANNGQEKKQYSNAKVHYWRQQNIPLHKHKMAAKPVNA